MKNLFFISFFCILQILWGCAPKVALKSSEQIDSTENKCPFEVSYKQWFLNPQSGTIVGYPQRGISTIKDAKVRTAGYGRMFVKGKINSYHDESYYNRQDSVSFYFDSTGVDSLQNLRIIDSMFICCPSQVYLATVDSSQKESIDTSSQSPCDPPSANLPENYQDSQNLYGKGISHLSYYDQASSWMTAEESAIKNLCRQSLIRISSMRKSITVDDKSEMSSTSSIEMDIEVRNIRVISRYYDQKSNNCTVWVACGKSDVKPWKGASN